MATTISWNSDSNGQWTVNSNWDQNRQPNSSDVIEIDRPGFLPTITLNEPNQLSITINELTTKEPFIYRNGDLTTDANSVMTFDGDLGGDGVDNQNLINQPGNPDGFVDSPSVLGQLSNSLNGNAGFTNLGTINIINGGYLGLGEATALPIVNAGTINVGNATTKGRLIFFGFNWSNQNGIINLSPGSELVLGQSFNLSSIGTVNRDINNTKVIIRGTLVTEFNPLILNNTRGSYILQGGTIKGSYIQQSPNKLKFTSFEEAGGLYNVLENLEQLTGDLDLTPEGSAVVLRNLFFDEPIEGVANLGKNAQLVLENTSGFTDFREIVNLGESASLRVSARDSTQLVSGVKQTTLNLLNGSQVNMTAPGATVGSDAVFNGNEQNQGIGVFNNFGIITATGNGNRIINPDQFINARAGSRFGTIIAQNVTNLLIGDTNRQNGAAGANRTFRNRGVLRVNGATVTLIGDFANESNGVIDLQANGILKLQGPFNPSDITTGTLTRNATSRVEIIGTLQPDGADTTLNLNNKGDFFLNGGVINNVNVSQTPTAQLRFDNNNNNVILNNAVVENTLNLTNSNAVVTLRNGGSFTGTATLGANAALVVDDTDQVEVDKEINFPNQTFILGSMGAVFGPQATDKVILGQDATVQLNAPNTSITSDLGDRTGSGIGTGTIINNGNITSNSTGSIRPDQFDNQGTVSALAGSTLTVGGTTLAGDTTSVVNYNAGNKTLTGGTWEAIGGTLNLSSIPVENNAATIAISGPGQILGLGNLSSNSNSFSLTNGADFTTSSAFTNSGDFVIANNSRFSASGAFTQTAGNLSADGNLAAGQVSIQGGQLNPGGTNGIGGLNITGNYTQDTNGVVNIELGGTGTGLFDRIDVLGNATFAANTPVNVSLVNDFVPQEGDSFTIFNFGNGTNPNNIQFTFPTLPGDLQFTTQINNTNITLVVGSASVGPETPSTVVTTLDDIVNDSDGLISLREAIAYANTGDTVTFDPNLNGGTITLGGTELAIAKSLTINGDTTNDNNPDITVSGGGQSRVFNINDGNSANSNVTLNGLNIINGFVGNSGGGIFSAEVLTLSNSTISGNSARYVGGVLSSGTASFSNSTISGNSASSSHGGVYNNRGVINIDNSTISGNSASSGGGIGNNRGVINIDNSTISGNSASSSGGGVYNNHGVINIDNSTISDNSASSSGGGVWNNRGTATVTNSTISGNNTSSGGGLNNHYGTLNVVNTTISGNSASSSGGGVMNFFGIANIDDSTLSGNFARNRGGGVYNNRSVISFNKSTISGNSVSIGSGGGISNFLGTAIFSNSTISGNSASSSGGGIANDSTVSIRNSTVTNNIAPANQGSGIASGGQSSTITRLTSSIVSGNTNTDIDFTGTTNSFISNGHNLTGSGNATSAFNQSTDIIDTNPGLGSLADNGGPTFTHAILEGSPAIDAGSNPDNLTTDQRGEGFPRTKGTATDIGAFESDFTAIITQPGVIQFRSTNFSVVEDGTVVQAITLVRTDGSDGEVSITVTPSDGTATAGDDFNPTPVVVPFADGQIEATVTIDIVDDDIVEGDETVNLTLSDPTDGATLGAQDTAVLTIIDNDFQGTPGRNVIVGTPGNDIIIASTGRDMLTGLEGNDTFVYNRLTDAGDIITDFTPGQDLLDFNGVMESIGFSGIDPLASGYITFSQSGRNNTLVNIDPDGSGGSASPRAFILLQNVFPSDLGIDNFVPFS